MLTFFYVSQFVISLLLILLVMFQKSEGGTSLISSNTYNSFFSARTSVTSSLTKITLIFGFALFINSVVIGAIHINSNKEDNDLLNKIQEAQKSKESPVETKIDDKPKVPLGNK